MKRILIISMCTLLCLHLAGCAEKSNHGIKESGLIQEKENVGTAATEENTIPMKEENSTYVAADVFYDEVQYAMEENILEAGAEVIYDNIAYQVLETEITNEFGNRKKENLDDVGHLYTDENGNLTGDDKYVFVKVRFTNTSDEEKEFYRNVGRVVAINQERRIFLTGVDAVYMDPLWTEGGPTAVYHYVLKPNESVESELGYIISPSEYRFSVSDDLYYLIGTREIGTSNLGGLYNRYVKLEE